MHHAALALPMSAADLHAGFYLGPSSRRRTDVLVRGPEHTAVTIDDLISEFQRLGQSMKLSLHMLRSGQDDIRQSDPGAAEHIEARIEAIIRQVDDLVTYMEQVQDAE